MTMRGIVVCRCVFVELGDKLFSNSLIGHDLAPAKGNPLGLHSHFDDNRPTAPAMVEYRVPLDRPPWDGNSIDSVFHRPHTSLGRTNSAELDLNFSSFP